MLWWGENEFPDPEIDQDLMKRALDLGISVENIHVPYKDANRLWTTDIDVHKAYLSRYMAYIDFSSKHGLSSIVMHVSEGDQVKRPNRYGIDAMSRLCTYGRKSGVSIAIENTRKVELVAALLEGIDDENLGLCYDTSHGRLYEESSFWLLKKFPQRLKYLHISDNDGVEDRHWNIGEGVVDWECFAQHVPTEGNCQSLSLEVYPRDKDQEEIEFLRKAFESANRLRAVVTKKTS
jgi:sugar phosphate isomerase/epimerase